ncbi:MAG: tRNA (N(6)-L-threonylcarbamoyladenosine(37)-C(2))-methylthiotransferase [Candidatus Methanospirareceae archaeon]
MTEMTGGISPLAGILSSEEKKKIYIETFGCTANIGDELRMRAVLKERGHSIVKEESEADIIIVNTCTVTKRTELNMIKRIKELKERSRDKEIIVAGCMAKAQPELLQSILGEDVRLITPSDVHHADFNFDMDGVIGIIPISMGCVGSCSYCIVKKARGDLRSYDLDKICKKVEEVVRRGAKEIRITSQDCSAYGLDMKGCGYRLPELLERVVSIGGDFKVRVGMMNPFTMIDILDEVIDAFDHDKIFKFFHIPVQSGSDSVLRDMRRNYKVADFVEIVRSIRRRFKDCVICTDFIIGYPTETEEDFLASLKLLEEVKPEKVNITRFSPRPFTEAAKLKDMLEREKKRRSRIFSETYLRMIYEKNKELEGRRVRVLITEKGRKGGVIGRDDAYRTIVIEGDLELGLSCEVRIKEARSTYLVGERCS